MVKRFPSQQLKYIVEKPAFQKVNFPATFSLFFKIPTFVLCFKFTAQALVQNTETTFLLASLFILILWHERARASLKMADRLSFSLLEGSAFPIQIYPTQCTLCTLHMQDYLSADQIYSVHVENLAPPDCYVLYSRRINIHYGHWPIRRHFLGFLLQIL
jgi:hypothetical protein